MSITCLRTYAPKRQGPDAAVRNNTVVGRGLLLALVPLTAALGLLSLPVLYVIAFLTGSLSVLFMAAYSALFVALVPRDGAYMVVNYGVRPLGSLAAGVLATAIGTRETLWIAAAGGTLAVLWLVRSPLLRMRELPEAAAAEQAGEAAA